MVLLWSGCADSGMQNTKQEKCHNLKEKPRLDPRVVIQEKMGTLFVFNRAYRGTEAETRVNKGLLWVLAAGLSC